MRTPLYYLNFLNLVQIYTWQMNFNLTKCNIMTITRSTVDRPACYYIQKHKLENISSSHKCHDIIIQDDLQWHNHVG